MEMVFSLFEVCAKKDRFGVRGNGIGLATVKRIIEKCGGKIQVKSTLEEGSTFTFEIPVV
jgi:signal transduction histidine kinase